MIWLPALLLLIQDQPAFRSDVTLVHVDAEVRQGERVVDGLSRDSLLITDTGKPQRILHFSHDDQPLDVVLLFDVSAETRLSIPRVSEAAHTVLGEMHESDRLTVLASGDRGDCTPHLIPDLANTTIQENAGGRSCGDLIGIRAAAEQLLRQPHDGRRRAIVVVTDHQGDAAKPRLVHDTARDLWGADAVVLGILVHSGRVGISIGPPLRGVRYAADMTGGDVVNRDDPVDGLREMIRRLRERYSFDYAMPPGTPGEERKIQVRLSRDAARSYPRAQLRARRGYVVPLQ